MDNNDDEKQVKEKQKKEKKVNEKEVKEEGVKEDRMRRLLGGFGSSSHGKVEGAAVL